MNWPMNFDVSQFWLALMCVVLALSITGGLTTSILSGKSAASILSRCHSAILKSALRKSQTAVCFRRRGLRNA